MSYKEQIELDKVPSHVAIIMDGNGRWAKQQGELRTFGHTSGVEAVREALTAAGEIRVKHLTLYAFSTENWNRPLQEVNALMDLLVSTIMNEIDSLQKNKVNILGPFPADTLFLKNNRKKFDIVVGMYHDQVLTPIKTLFEYDAINVTIGLPFIRVSPDHGPNEQMLGINKSNSLSLLRSIQFLDF